MFNDDDFDEEYAVDEESEYDFSELEDDEQQKNVLVKSVDGIQLPDAWGQAATSMDQVSRHRQSFNLKHGMFANVPMICKGTECPMHELCDIPIRKRPVFKRCPIEIAAILDRYDKYCAEIGVGPEDYFDQSQVKDLVDIEVKLLRSNGVLAISGHFIEEVVAGIDDKGKEYLRPELHKATEYEEKLLNRKRQILADLNATRKAKGQDQQASEASSFASELMRKAMKAQQDINRTIIDIPFDDDESVDESVNTDTKQDGEE